MTSICNQYFYINLNISLKTRLNMSFVELTPAIRSFQGMVKPFFKDDYATIELDDSIPCIRLTLDGVPRYSEHYHYVQAKRIELMRLEIKNYPKLHMLTDSRTAG